MADNSFRSYRRDPLARDTDPPRRDGAGDPLAELARLIGQSDPHSGQGQDTGEPAEAYDEAAAPASGLDWAAADDGYAEHSRERDYEEPATARQYSPPVAAFNDTREDLRRDARAPDARDRAEPPRPAASRTYIPPSHEGLPADARDHYGGQVPSYAGDYAQDEYEEEVPPRRSGTVVIVAVLGLAVLGTAGALGYRAMFGGSVIPSLPPIIKPGNSPIKIVPNHDSQAGAPSQADGAARGSGDQVVTHEERPVDIPAANPVPRVVTTIPVISNAPEAGLPGAQPPVATVPAAPAPAPPPAAFTEPGNPARPFVAAEQPTAPPSAAPTSGTKKVHTVTIRRDQPGAANPAAGGPAAAARPAKAHESPPRPRREAAAGPLSIVPTQQGGALPPPTRTAMAHPSTPIPLTSPRAAAAPSAGGGYAVQVSSQRSEAEAQAAFRSLQARYPQQLEGRHAIVRRADLGAKGIYYRALVGPFASAEQAAGLCSSLKAAGGNCIIQRD